MENALERVEKLLALLLIQNMTGQKEKALHLSIAGFSNVEVADLLQTSGAVVAQLLYMSKKTKKKKKKKKN
jgi:hypothetical protein